MREAVFGPIHLQRQTLFSVLSFAYACSFNFKDGDKLMFKDEGKNAVIHIESIQYYCPKTTGRMLSSKLSVSSVSIWNKPSIKPRGLQRRRLNPIDFNSALINCPAYGAYFLDACAGNRGQCIRPPSMAEVLAICDEQQNVPQCISDPNAQASIDCKDESRRLSGNRRLLLTFTIECTFNWFYLTCHITIIP